MFSFVVCRGNLTDYFIFMQEKKYNFVYQTKNMVNGKTYIGVHSTNKLDDGYIGCGIKKANFTYNDKNCKSIFQKAVKKYGYHNFKVEILDFFDTADEAYKEESYLVTEEWVNRKNTYNMVLGGGRPPLQTREKYPKSKELRKKVSQLSTGKESNHYKGDIYQVCMETREILGVFHTARLAGKYIGKDGHGIAKVLRGQALFAFGFYWTRNPSNLQEEINLFNKNHAAKIASRNSCKKVVGKNLLSGKIIEFPSINDAARFLIKGEITEKETKKIAYLIKSNKNINGFNWKLKDG